MNLEPELAVAGLRCRWRVRGLPWRLIAAGLIGIATLHAADPVPVIVQHVPGRFEVAAVDPVVGHAVAALAEEGWRQLAGPLGFPDQFVTPIYLRVLTAATGPAVVPFQVSVETGGIVSVAMRAETLSVAVARRAFVQGMLMRLAVAQQGVTERLRVPRWLEEGGVIWWQTRSDAAQLDSIRQQTARLTPPALSDVLHWQRGPSDSPGFSAASFWLLTFLQGESRRTGEWTALVKALLTGDDPEPALAASYPGRFADDRERELWWQTGWHLVSRAHSLPALDAAESRAHLGALARFVLAAPTGDADVVWPLSEVVQRAAEPIVTVEFGRRANELNRLVPLLHPFYRNAGLSLAEVFRAGSAKPTRRAELAAAFEQDWREAKELETETTAALDALEAKRPR